MNLEKLRLHKKLLMMKRYLCFAMSFLMLTNAAKGLSENIERSDDNYDISYESIVDYSVVSKTIGWKPNIIDEAINIHESKIALISSSLESVTMQMETLEPAELTYEEKMLAIMEREGYTYDELDAVCAGCVAESCGDPNCYNEAYNVASTFNNRTHCPAYVNDVSNFFGENAGYSIYYQLIAPNQFSVWSSGLYKEYLGRIDLVGYQAAIDMFYSGIPSHDYLNFNYIPDKSLPSYQLDEGHTGNYYCRELLEENRIDDEKVIELVLTLNS